MVDRAYPVDTTQGTRSMLEAWLEFQNQGVMSKTEGLSDTNARASLVPSQTTILGLVRHLTNTQHWWIHCVMAGGLENSELANRDEFDLGDSTLEAERKRFADECAQSRIAMTKIESLDTAAALAKYEELSYGWILVHMIEETARHLGHIDILREQLDGVVGR